MFVNDEVVVVEVIELEKTLSIVMKEDGTTSSEVANNNMLEGSLMPAEGRMTEVEIEPFE